jgi:hypothetical protein
MVQVEECLTSMGKALESTKRTLCSHVSHNDILISSGPQVQQWSHKTGSRADFVAILACADALCDVHPASESLLRMCLCH